MRYFDAAALEAALGYPHLVDVLDNAFRQGALSPPRQHHTIQLADRPAATLLLMPAWTSSAPGAATAGTFIGIKIATVFPDNARLGKPSVNGAYVLLSAVTGEPLAIMDAARLTVLRTAAASALAARYLARPDASRMVMVGAGALSPYLVRAHASVRPIREVLVWNRTPAHAEDVVRRLAGSGFRSAVASDLETAVRDADIVSTATISSTPLIRGAWLKPGCHVDCVGAFRPDMRETDDEVVRRSRIWVDTRAGALSEAGDILIPLEAGVIAESAIEGDLFDLSRGIAPVRRTPGEITMFKSVGASIEDLAAAVAVYEGDRR
jgi:ornithine cyclodeaminase/alanine dehydrogenase-like protein (mu-crystallin family)